MLPDSSRGQLLEKREYASGAYLTHLNDSGGSQSKRTSLPERPLASTPSSICCTIMPWRSGA